MNNFIIARLVEPKEVRAICSHSFHTLSQKEIPSLERTSTLLYSTKRINYSGNTNDVRVLSLSPLLPRQHKVVMRCLVEVAHNSNTFF